MQNKFTARLTRKFKNKTMKNSNNRGKGGGQPEKRSDFMSRFETNTQNYTPPLTSVNNPETRTDLVDRYGNNMKKYSQNFMDMTDSNITNNHINTIKNERQGVIDMIGNVIKSATYSTLRSAGDIGLNALGLQRIDKSSQNGSPEERRSTGEQFDEGYSKFNDSTSGVTSLINKTSTAVIDNINQVLDSEPVSQSVEEAAQKTARITSELADKFNTAMDDPVVRVQVEKAIENAGKMGTVIARASEEPMKEVARVTAEAGTKALGETGAGMIKVGTNMLGAIPFVGAAVQVGKIINDGSKATSAVVEAGTDIIESSADSLIKIKENVENELKMLEEQKKIGEQISNRTTNSINQFENPLQISENKPIVGGRKTRKYHLRSKRKSKRVRFVN
jgi:hypothetical protein